MGDAYRDRSGDVNGLDCASTETAAGVEAGIIIGAGTEAKTPPAREGFEAAPYAIVPKGTELKSLAGQYARELPKRRTGTIALADAPSFIGYVNAFKLTETVVFADPATNLVTAVFDYHQPGAEGLPRWGQHRATLALAFTEAWSRWTEQDGEKVDQLTFAEFIENNLQDIAEPDGSTILQISRSLEATKEVGFKSGVRLSDGQTQLSYMEKLAATAEVNESRMAIPERFTLGLMPFEGGNTKYQVVARLRYRIAPGGKLAIGFDLLRPDIVVEDARKATLQVIGTQISVTILRGTPPAVATA